MAKTTTIQLRCTEDFKQKITLAAKKENRTLSNYIINKLEEDLKMDDQKFYATLCDPTTGEYYTVECDSAEQAYELECGC